MSRYSTRRAMRAYNPVAVQTRDPLRDAAVAASDARNQLNYAHCGASDLEPARLVEHYTALINLVGEADKAWRAVAERDGVPYRACVDCGWLPRYCEALETAKRSVQRVANGR